MNPQNINMNWRPRKWISAVTKELAYRWYDPATPEEIKANYMSMIQLEATELEKLLADFSKPVLVNILAKNLLSDKWFEIAEKMIDRSHGKPAQKIDWEQKVDVSVTDERIKEMTAEELSAYLQSKMK